ncbi:hypothetical protein [Hymenobacter sp. B81]|uniref:hypothetical protein n=1 Tax=Hymenobacter sp. B81 TaxID=3344878 RepID=UPI0037DCF89D
MTTFFSQPAGRLSLPTRPGSVLWTALLATWNAGLPQEPGASPRYQQLLRRQHRVTRLFWLGTAAIFLSALLVAA